MTDPEQFYYTPNEPLPRPPLSVIAKHLFLLALTFCTAMIAGALFPFGRIDTLPEADPQTWPEITNFVLSIPQKYVGLIGDAIYRLATDQSVFLDGITFALSLLFILFCHEMGHYVACRVYRVDATLPYFIPTPPLVGPAGTFGAFIKIRSPIPSRKAVFDIGVAGPIAGFVALIPIAILGITTMQVATAQQVAGSSGLVFSDPLLMRLVAYFFGINLQFGMGNSFYFAAWVGLLVTALNLIPSGQLDGGHAVYAVFGEKVHKWTGRIAFPVMATLSFVGMYYYGSPSGLLIAIILFVMMRVGHPSPIDQAPLDAKRKFVAFLTLVIFILCFVPFPIQLS